MQILQYKLLFSYFSLHACPGVGRCSEVLIKLLKINQSTNKIKLKFQLPTHEMKVVALFRPQWKRAHLWFTSVTVHKTVFKTWVLNSVLGPDQSRAEPSRADPIRTGPVPQAVSLELLVYGLVWGNDENALNIAIYRKEKWTAGDFKVERKTNKKKPTSVSCN